MPQRDFTERPTTDNAEKGSGAEVLEDLPKKRAKTDSEAAKRTAQLNIAPIAESALEVAFVENVKECITRAATRGFTQTMVTVEQEIEQAAERAVLNIAMKVVETAVSRAAQLPAKKTKRKDKTALVMANGENGLKYFQFYPRVKDRVQVVLKTTTPLCQHRA